MTNYIVVSCALARYDGMVEGVTAISVHSRKEDAEQSLVEYSKTKRGYEDVFVVEVGSLIYHGT